LDAALLADLENKHQYTDQLIVAAAENVIVTRITIISNIIIIT
jgi:hypothetical protein